jgi:hypothetical protein
MIRGTISVGKFTAADLDGKPVHMSLFRGKDPVSGKESESLWIDGVLSVDLHPEGMVVRATFPREDIPGQEVWNFTQGDYDSLVSDGKGGFIKS